MPEIAELLAANRRYADTHVASGDARPSRHLAVVTCMDARIDVFAVLGLAPGEAHVMRNAGGRVTDDMLRSLALSVHVLGVDSVVVMHHTKCGLTGVSDQELQDLTGADLEFLTIDDHEVALRSDIERLASQSYLQPIRSMAAFLWDVESGSIREVLREERPGADRLD